VTFALKRFYSEKRWERKEKAYTRIIEALHYIWNHADHNYKAAMLNKDIPDEIDLRLMDEMNKSVAELRKQIDIGTFVVSEEAVKVLGILMKELDRSTKNKLWTEHLTTKMEATEKCLAEMRTIARKDLKLP